MSLFLNLKPWSNYPTFHPKFYATFDDMFDGVQCRGGQTIQPSTEKLKAIEMFNEILVCF